eukprot:TRINITY_DN38798_c0_g1_i1.p1 TRINITY_DN38798_c0_g1~~TRINITY_DN38798_c0_g1_i1.p1  ORF type:complete len:377 (+),score=82.62 TRINITY_DN38798_c0_g1_i1:134-1264(+)
MEEEREKKAWEQHGSIISIPRFDYKASSSLSHSSHSGFLITCPMKREKSATKEALNILKQYFSFPMSTTCDTQFSVERCQISKRREMEMTYGNDNVSPVDAHKKPRGKKSKVLDGKEPPMHSNANSSTVIQLDVESSPSGVESDSELTTQEKDKIMTSVCSKIQITKAVEQASIEVNDKTEPCNSSCTALSLVKLARNGVLFFALPGTSTPNVVDILKSIFRDLDAGEIKCPQWCHRILPIQATCSLKEEAIHHVVMLLIRALVGVAERDPERALKFAVAYNRRGVNERELGNDGSLLGRSECIRVVASAVTKVLPLATVDLQSPEIAVFVEVLPLSGAHTSCVTGVSVLPGNLVHGKPRLCVRPVVLDVNDMKRR